MPSATRPIVLILVLAFAVRLALVVGTPHFTPNNDPADYDMTARSIAHGHGYPPTILAAPGGPSALRPPAYPYLLGALYAVVGHSYTAGRVLGVLLGVLVVALVYLVGRFLGPERYALIAAGLAAVFPPLIALSGSLLSEPLFLALELSIVFVVLLYRDRPGRLSLPVLAGVLCGVAALTRSVGLLLVIAALVGLLTVPTPRPRARLVVAAAFLAATCLTVAPWTVRNAIVFHGAFVPVSTQDGITAAGTYNADAATPGPYRAVWRPPYLVPAFQRLFRDSIDEVQLDETLRNHATAYAVDHPRYVATAVAFDTLRLAYVGPAHQRVNRAWYHEMGVPRSAEAWVSASGDLVIFVAAIGAGLCWARRNRRTHRTPMFVWLVPLLMYLAVVPIHGAFRYRAPLDPFLVLLAAFAIASAAETARGSRARVTR